MRALTEKQQKTLASANNGVWHKGFGSRIAQRFLTESGEELNRRVCESLIDKGYLYIKKESAFSAIGKLVVKNG